MIDRRENTAHEAVFSHYGNRCFNRRSEEHPARRFDALAEMLAQTLAPYLLPIG